MLYLKSALHVITVFDKFQFVILNYFTLLKTDFRTSACCIVEKICKQIELIYELCLKKKSSPLKRIFSTYRKGVITYIWIF